MKMRHSRGSPLNEYVFVRAVVIGAVPTKSQKLSTFKSSNTPLIAVSVYSIRKFYSVAAPSAKAKKLFFGENNTLLNTSHMFPYALLQLLL